MILTRNNDRLVSRKTFFNFHFGAAKDTYLHSLTVDAPLLGEVNENHRRSLLVADDGFTRQGHHGYHLVAYNLRLSHHPDFYHVLRVGHPDTGHIGPRARIG